MINIFDFYSANSSLFSTDDNIWPTQVLLHIVDNVPNEGRLFFPKGNYIFNNPNQEINIHRPLVISGSGNYTVFELHKTFLLGSSHITLENISFERHTASNEGIVVTYSPYTSFRNLTFHNLNQKITPAIIVASTAPNWYLENIEITGFHSGLQNDANFGTCINLTVLGGATGGAGIFDTCKSGSTYINCSTTGHPSMGIQCLYKGFFVGCYSDDKVEIQKDTLWLGGNLDYQTLSDDTSGTIFTKNAFKQFHKNVKGVEFHKNDNDPTPHPAHFFAGGGGNNVVFEFPSTDNLTEAKWQLIFDSQDINYKLKLFGQSEAALCFSAGHPTDHPNLSVPFMKPGKLGFPRGYYLGKGSNFIHVDSSITKPLLSEGKKGDRVMNRSPKVKSLQSSTILPENYMGWICITSAESGQNAEWKGFGLLEG